MTIILRNALLLVLCGRLLYIEPEIELTTLELIATIFLFIDFNFRGYFKNMFDSLFRIE